MWFTEAIRHVWQHGDRLVLRSSMCKFLKDLSSPIQFGATLAIRGQATFAIDSHPAREKRELHTEKRTMSPVSSTPSVAIYAPPESRNEPKHDNDADDRGPKALSAAAQASTSSSAIQLSST